MREAKALSCVHCEGNHHANDCPVMHEQAIYLGIFNINSNNPYLNTYNPGWRQHPNFSWNNQGGTNASSSSRQQNMNAPPGFQANMPWHSETKGNTSTSNSNSMEATMQEFISTTKTMLQKHSTSIKHQGNMLQTQGSLLQSHNKGEKLDNEKTEEQHVNAATSSTPKPARDEVRPPPPFPQRLKKHKEDLQFQKFVMADQTMTINVFNTLRYMDDQGECYHLQEENTTAVEEDSDIICCSKFIQIKDLERLKKGDDEEPEATPGESNQFKKAIGWTMADLKGISPTICMHKIILEECHSNSVEPQRRLNPAMKKVVMK
ncbi:hypothetical protein GQ457_03G017400 [Hibiscus cannabinus]